MKKSLSVVIFGAVGILEFEPMLFSLLSSEKNKAKASGETFLKIEEIKILFEKYLIMWWVWDLFLKSTYFLIFRTGSEE